MGAAKVLIPVEDCSARTTSPSLLLRNAGVVLVGALFSYWGSLLTDELFVVSRG